MSFKLDFNLFECESELLLVLGAPIPVEPGSVLLSAEESTQHHAYEVRDSAGWALEINLYDLLQR